MVHRTRGDSLGGASRITPVSFECSTWKGALFAVVVAGCAMQGESPPTDRQSSDASGIVVVAESTVFTIPSAYSGRLQGIWQTRRGMPSSCFAVRTQSCPSVARRAIAADPSARCLRIQPPRSSTRCLSTAAADMRWAIRQGRFCGGDRETARASSVLSHTLDSGSATIAAAGGVIAVARVDRERGLVISVARGDSTFRSDGSARRRSRAYASCSVTLWEEYLSPQLSRSSSQRATSPIRLPV